MALTRKPDFIDAYNNLARAFWSAGQADNALGALRRALAITETAATKSLFVQCVRRLAVPPDVEDFRALMVRALSEPWGRTNDLAPVAARLVKQDAALAACMARVAQAWPRRLPADELLGPAGIAPISGNRLLRCVMEAGGVERPRARAASDRAAVRGPGDGIGVGPRRPTTTACWISAARWRGSVSSTSRCSPIPTRRSAGRGSCGMP